MYLFYLLFKAGASVIEDCSSTVGRSFRKHLRFPAKFRHAIHCHSPRLLTWYMTQAWAPENKWQLRALSVAKSELLKRTFSSGVRVFGSVPFVVILVLAYAVEGIKWAGDERLGTRHYLVDIKRWFPC